MGTLGKLRAALNNLKEEWEGAEIFGINLNGEITAAKLVTENLCSVALSLQPRDSGSGGGAAKSPEQIMAEMCENLLEQLPDDFDLEVALYKRPIIREEVLNTVINQELLRFNKLTN